jgi:DNA helicase IV
VLPSDGGLLVKTLPPIKPTAEQLPLISDNNLGIEVIRGAAGSGKTSTAILRLRSLAYMFEERREREGTAAPVKILVLAFNRTLRGYIRALVDDQVAGLKNTIVTIDTFSRWAMQHLGHPRVVDDASREAKIKQLGRPLTALSAEYVVKEVEYVLGRFEPDSLDRYIAAERTGRGTEPRVEGPLRRRILDEVIAPYRQWLADRRLWDWNDVAVAMANAPEQRGYDVVIVDESQDFSANQLRAIRHHIAPDHAVTFVIDTVQRIYARGFTWVEAGFKMRGARYRSLKENHRNTAEIAAFAAGLLENMAVEEDGALPDLATARRHGARPTVIRGKYDAQAVWALAFLRRQVDFATEQLRS